MRLRFVSIVSLALVLACGQPGDSQTARRTKSQPTPQTKSQPTLVAASYPNLELQAKELSEALMRRDMQRFIDLTNPKLVEFAGGRERFISRLLKKIDEQEASGIKLLSYTSEVPTKLIRDSGNLYAVLPVTLTSEMPQGVFVSFSYMIGVSGDDGSNWTFIDAGSGGKDGLKKFLGAVVDKLELPQQRTPVKISGYPKAEGRS